MQFIDRFIGGILSNAFARPDHVDSCMSRYCIRQYQSLAELPQADWCRLDGPAAHCNYGWLRSVERFRSEPLELQFLVAYENDSPVGAVILERVTEPDREGGIARYIFGGKRNLRKTLGQWLLPALSAGAPHGYGGQLMLAANVAAGSARQVVSQLIRAAESLSSEQNTPLWFSGVMASEQLLLNSLRAAGYQSARYLPIAELKIEWSSFDEYANDLKQRHKNVAKDIRRERNRCRAAGVNFDEPDEIDSYDVAYIRLANETYARHGDSPFPFTNGFFSDLRRELGDDFLACNATKNGNLLGFVTMLVDGDTAWGDSYGLDYSNPDSTFAYFNLIFHWPIQKAIELGLKRIVFGRGQYTLKLRRGCSLTDTFFLHKPAGGIQAFLHRPVFRLLDRHYARRPGIED